MTIWKNAIEKIDLSISEGTDVIATKVSIIEEMRTTAASARNLQEKRIDAIERDISSFQESVATLTSELAPDLVDADAYRSVIELDRRREHALHQRDEQLRLSKATKDQSKEIDKLKKDQASSLLSINELFDIAKVEKDEELREAIELADRKRELERRVNDLEDTLNKQGDGFGFDALEDECRDVEVDTLEARQQELEAEEKALHERLEEAVETRIQAQTAFKEIIGSDDPAKAAADGEDALATMQDVVQRYIRLWASGTLLRWVIDRYRKEKQGPLLKRASGMFNTLTRGSFERLEVGFENNDNDLRLFGVRSDGAYVDVPGLSTGTEDQLFLALRVSAVEDYIKHAVTMPFIADDLFINFDRERAAAGFEILGHLAEKTQILFFTHHIHLLELAQEVLGDDIHVTNLPSTV